MRVGIMSPGLSPGDAIGNDIMGMYAVSRQMGYETYLFTPDGTSGTALEVYSYSDVGWLLANPSDLLIYHCCTWDVVAMRVLRQLDCRIAIKYHNVTPSVFMAEYSVDFTKGTRMGREQLVEFVELPVARFISDSNFNADELERFGADPELRAVVPPFHHVENLLGYQEAARTAAQVLSHTNNIVAVGRVVPNKGLDVLIEAMVELRQMGGAPAHLHIVGSYDQRMHGYKTKLTEMIAKGGIERNVTFHGTVTAQELATFYRQCDIFCTTSHHEGFCVPAIEAMAFGKPVISSRAGALPETCGDAALYFDTIPELADHLDRLLSDDEQRVMLGRAGRARFDDLFRNGRIEARFVEVLRAIDEETAARVEAKSLTVGKGWPAVPGVEKVVAMALDVASPLPPKALVGLDRRLDFLDWIVREGLGRSKPLAAHFASESLRTFAANIEVPPSASHFTPAMRLAWFFSRRAQALFDLRDPQQAAGFVRWYRREAGAYDGALNG